jgi:hypothetical protein
LREAYGIGAPDVNEIIDALIDLSEPKRSK